MGPINKHGWSRKWRRILIVSSLTSVTLLAPFAIVGYNRYGVYGVLPLVIIYLIYTIPINRYISRKNKEAVQNANL